MQNQKKALLSSFSYNKLLSVMRYRRLKCIILLLLMVPSFVAACGKDYSFPYKVESLVDEPFTTNQCYPFEVRFPTKYNGETINTGFIKFYSAMVAVRSGYNGNAAFETELKISNIKSLNESLIRLCLSADVADTTVIELIYRRVYEEGYSGPVAMCGPTVHTIYGFKGHIK